MCKAVLAWQGWLPWLLVSAVVIVWTFLKIFTIAEAKVPWPGLDNAVFITLYNQPYAAVWDFQPLATGTAILLATVLTAAFVGVDHAALSMRSADLETNMDRGDYGGARPRTRLPDELLRHDVHARERRRVAGNPVPFGFGLPRLDRRVLTGSDTSANALFGNLQVVASNQLQLNPILFAATNDSGGALGKMISPQNLTTAVSVTDLKGKEGVVFARTFKHSIVLTVILCLLVVVQQYLFPSVIPH